MVKQILLSSALLTAFSVMAEKKPLDHSVYDNWKSIGEQAVSADGRYGMYQITPQEGDGVLVFQDLKTGEQLRIERGYNGRISADGKNAVCLIKAPFAATRQAKIKKKKGDDLPQDSLAIIQLASGSVEKIADVKSYKTGHELTSGFAYLAREATAAQDSAKTEKSGKKKKKEDLLIIRQFGSNRTDTLRQVTDYTFSFDGKQVAAIAKADTSKLQEVYHYSFPQRKSVKIASGLPLFKQLSYDKAGKQLAFLGSSDTCTLYSKSCALYLFDTEKQDTARLLASATGNGLAAGWEISEHSAPQFSESGEQLFIGTAPKIQLRDTTLVDFETAALDIWHYAEPHIQPMQLVRKDREIKRTYLAYIDPRNGEKLVPLADTRVKETLLVNRGDASFVIGIDQTPYEIQIQWMGGDIPADYYLIDVKSGKQQLIGKEIFGRLTPSPDGKFLIWFDTRKQNYFTYEIASATTRNLTGNLNIAFQDEENDTPGNAREYGIAGWLEQDKGVLVYDYFDIWQLDPAGKEKAICLTGGMGRKENTVLRNITLDREKRFFTKKDELLLSALNKTSKQKGYYTLRLANKQLTRRIVEGFNYMSVQKAKNANTWLFQKANFTTSPEMYVTTDYWKNSRVLSDINPQMKEYNWGTADLFHWTTFSGKPAEGIVYKPENFDPNKKYPVMIYFYERLSDNLYNYVTPAPSRSTINISFYTSRGYIVFTPDIRYTRGEPGESAYDYIVSGAEKLAESPWVNKQKMAIQGQSWGGYQVAYLITRTNMFAAAGSGAPVSNMTSAYGGIRWTTGMSRQFQYELTQSRIGSTLWEGFDQYVKNSPVFFADKVNTPVLIMHNDNDGAVPWYQGVEFFMGLRRLGKTAWLLQYNKEEHNLMERRNTRDLVVRLQQFFDHYLKDEPMPAWMKKGVPATRKGMYFGFETEE